MFFQFGISRVTMEEIAESLGISKKTLYKHFPNKETIIKEMFIEHKNEIAIYVESVMQEEIDFMDKLKKLMTYFGKSSGSLKGPLASDLIKNYPEIWKEIQEYKREKGLKQFTRLVEEGMKTGVFRNDIEKDIVVLIYIGAINEILTPEILSLFPISAEQVFRNIPKIIFEGILTNEAREIYCTKNLKPKEEIK